MQRLAITLLATSLLACSGGTTASPPATPSAEQVSGLEARLPNGAAPDPGVYTAGQPSEEQFASVRDAGVRTVINLRLPSELSFDEAATVTGLGMNYVLIPVAGAEGLTEVNARALDDALQGEGPMLVHCHSSNRVGALFALRARLLKGASVEEALEVGRRHGMASDFEGAVRALLESLP